MEDEPSKNIPSDNKRRKLTRLYALSTKIIKVDYHTISIKSYLFLHSIEDHSDAGFL